MIDGGMEMLMSEGVGTSAVSLLKNKALPVGTVLLELVFLVQAQAPKRSGIQRFLPPTPIRVLLDGRGNDLSSQVDFDSFNRQLSPVNRHVANKLVTSVQKQVHDLIDAGTPVVEAQLATIRDLALQEMHQQLGAELERMQALKEVNPNIREEELVAQQTQIEELDQLIKHAQYQLDSLRVIMVAHN